jgi:hypothetical protein
MKDSIELRIEVKKLVIVAIKQPSASWSTGYGNEHDELVLDTIPVEAGDEEWVW